MQLYFNPALTKGKRENPCSEHFLFPTEEVSTYMALNYACTSGNLERVLFHSVLTDAAMQVLGIYKFPYIWTRSQATCTTTNYGDNAR